MLKRFLAALLIATPVFASAAHADAKFESFIQSLWPRVKAAGISRSLFDAAFAGVTDPDPAVLKLASTQPEFTSTIRLSRQGRDAHPH
jgi:membrane-bound lytic murein transglycosylase B